MFWNFMKSISSWVQLPRSLAFLPVCSTCVQAALGLRGCQQVHLPHPACGCLCSVTWQSLGVSSQATCTVQLPGLSASFPCDLCGSSFAQIPAEGIFLELKETMHVQYLVPSRLLMCNIIITITCVYCMMLPCVPFNKLLNKLLNILNAQRL